MEIDTDRLPVKENVFGWTVLLTAAFYPLADRQEIEEQLYRYDSEIKEAIRYGDITPLDNEPKAVPLAIDGRVVFKKPDYDATLSRDSIISWLKQRGELPDKWKKYLKHDSAENLNIETALTLISVLAKMADNRWKPGEKIPYGMAQKIVSTADLMGLQLDRNTIGKYLKEAGNKNISA